VSTGSQLQKAKAIYGANLNTGDVAERLANTVVLGVDDEGTLA